MNRPPPGHFVARIRGGPHDGHAHQFPLVSHPLAPTVLLEPPWIPVPSEYVDDVLTRQAGQLKRTGVADAAGLSIYVYCDLEGNEL